MQRVGHPVPVRVLVIEGRDVAGIIEKHSLPRAGLSPCGTKKGSHSHEGLGKIDPRIGPGLGARAALRGRRGRTGAPNAYGDAQSHSARSKKVDAACASFSQACGRIGLGPTLPRLARGFGRPSCGASASALLGHLARRPYGHGHSRGRPRSARRPSCRDSGGFRQVRAQPWPRARRRSQEARGRIGGAPGSAKPANVADRPNRANPWDRSFGSLRALRRRASRALSNGHEPIPARCTSERPPPRQERARAAGREPRGIGRETPATTERGVGPSRPGRDCQRARESRQPRAELLHSRSANSTFGVIVHHDLSTLAPGVDRGEGNNQNATTSHSRAMAHLLTKPDNIRASSFEA